MWITIAFENWHKAPLDLLPPSMDPGGSCEAEDFIQVFKSWDAVKEESSQKESILYYLTSEHDSCLGVFLDRMEKLALEVEVTEPFWRRGLQERLKPLSDLLDVQFLSLVNELGIVRLGRVSDRLVSRMDAFTDIEVESDVIPPKSDPESGSSEVSHKRAIAQAQARWAAEGGELKAVKIYGAAGFKRTVWQNFAAGKKIGLEAKEAFLGVLSLPRPKVLAKLDKPEHKLRRAQNK